MPYSLFIICDGTYRCRIRQKDVEYAKVTTRDINCKAQKSVKIQAINKSEI